MTRWISRAPEPSQVATGAGVQVARGRDGGRWRRAGPPGRGGWVAVVEAAMRAATRPVRTLVAIPVYNEQRYVQRVLELVLQFAPPPRQVLVLDDGSTDATPTLL